MHILNIWFGTAEQLMKEYAENEANKKIYHGLVLLGLVLPVYAP